MTDYNDGNWYGWNGGECPVHPDSQIHALEVGGVEWVSDAIYCHWPSFRGAFRVTKPYVEPKKPREFWLYRDIGDDFSIVYSAPSFHWDEVIHVREVIE